MDIRTLYDIPGFEGIRGVTKRFECELTVFGGFVRRVCGYLRNNDSLPDPEEIAYFSSDIDMVHSGPASKTCADYGDQFLVCTFHMQCASLSSIH
jgi:hypothetical protein